MPVKPVPQFLAYWQNFLESIKNCSSSQKIKIGIVGGGTGGVELALNMQARLGIICGFFFRRSLILVCADQKLDAYPVQRI
jgi:NADH dehydrogenase FAD-containing subunit